MKSYYHYTKDGVSVSVFLDTRRKLKNEEFPVKVCVCYRRRRTYFSTGKSFSAESWERLSITRNQAILSDRKDIENSFTLVRQAVEDLTNSGDFSLELLNSRLKMSGGLTLEDALGSRELELRDAGKFGSADVVRNVLFNLRKMSPRKISIQEVSVSWLRTFEQFLRTAGKAQTTIAIYMRTIRVTMNEYRRAGLIKESRYPFGRGKYEIQEGEGRKLALTLEQIGQIARYSDGTEATERYRDIWLFLYLCNGINVADFVKLRYQDVVDSEICFVRKKTESRTRQRKEIRVPLTPPMQRIIERWGNPPSRGAFIFPVLEDSDSEQRKNAKTKYFTRAINRRLHEIGEELGIGSISTYTARHSFATVLKRSGANIAYISESLGHQNLKTTENYLASFEREERQKNAELLMRF